MAARHRPRYLDEIMEVIVNLKEVKGSTSRRILDRVHNLLVLKRKRGKVDPWQIKKALTKGVEYGVLMKKDGKYKLGLDAKDYVIYRNWAEKHAQQTRKASGTKSRRMRKRIISKSRSPGRQRVRHYSSSDEADDSDTTGEHSQSDRSDKDDKSDKKKKKALIKKQSLDHKRSNSKGPEGSRSYVSAPDRSVTSIRENNKSRSKSRSTSKLKTRNSSGEIAGDRNKGHNMKDGKAPDNKQAPYCGNPDCLCNLCVDHNETK